ncbi:MAG TPA: response regulator [Bryobacteraceae bacterium]
MSIQEDEFIRSLRATFRIEAGEHLQAIATGLIELEKARAEEEKRGVIETVFRAAHSLKGAARAVNIVEIETVCESLENTFAAWRRQERAPSPQEIDSLHGLLDSAAKILDLPAHPQSSAAVSEDLTTLSASQSVPVEAASLASQGVEKTVDTVRISVAKLDAQLLEAEEMLMAKLTTSQRAADLRHLADDLDAWHKEFAAVQPEMRAFPQAGPRADSARLVEFIAGNQNCLQSVIDKVRTLRRAAEQDHFIVGRLVDDLLEDSKKMLMLPVGTLAALFPKVVRDLCRDQGKAAEIVIRGEEFEIDKRILEQMKDPFIHLLRNCMDHGIEKPAERVRRGKPSQATITVAISPVNGNRVEFLVSDDGAGIDIDKVRDAAIQRGLVSAEQARTMNDSETLALIFQADVSTSPIVTQLSGRGLGLAIVREKAEKLGGRVSVQSWPHAGTAIRIALPIALATFRGVLVEIAKRQFVVATAQVQRIVRFKAADIQTVESVETLAWNGRVVPLIRMTQILELPDAAPAESTAVAALPALILGADEQPVAFAVDAVLDEQQVLVKQFRKPLSRVRNIAGATVLASGQVALILNAADLLKSARKCSGVTAPATSRLKPAEDKSASILVVEDSITSRMLLKNILESAGYRVKTAVDGMEAFTILRTQPFDLVVSDVEMPRLNGFDLTAKIRAEKDLAKLPVVLVTALDSREDRERGINVGANAYLVKSSFDQSNLLEAVQRLA